MKQYKSVNDLPSIIRRVKEANDKPPIIKNMLLAHCRHQLIRFHQEVDADQIIFGSQNEEGKILPNPSNN